jgi:hypothetical protein
VQLSVGAAAAAAGNTGAVRVEWSDPAGHWHTATSAGGPVASDESAQFLLWRPGRPVTATGVRVVVQGGDGIRTAEVHALTAGEQ